MICWNGVWRPGRRQRMMASYCPANPAEKGKEKVARIAVRERSEDIVGLWSGFLTKRQKQPLQVQGWQNHDQQLSMGASHIRTFFRSSKVLTTFRFLKFKFHCRTRQPEDLALYNHMPLPLSFFYLFLPVRSLALRTEVPGPCLRTQHHG